MKRAVARLVRRRREQPAEIEPHQVACPEKQRSSGGPETATSLLCESTKDTFVTTALYADVKKAWLENQTGVAYETLRRHYGEWMRSEMESELHRFEQVART